MPRGARHELPLESWRVSLCRGRLVGGDLFVLGWRQQRCGAVSSSGVVELVAPGGHDGTVALSDSGRTGDATAAEARIQGPPKRHKFPRFASLCGHASSPSSLNATVPPALVQGAAAPQPACPADLDPDEPHRAPMATTHPRHAPLAECAFRRHTPEVGAQCGNPACWDPCGGPSARAVPTATLVVAIRPEVQDHRGTLSPARW